MAETNRQYYRPWESGQKCDENSCLVFVVPVLSHMRPRLEEWQAFPVRSLPGHFVCHFAYFKLYKKK